MFGRPEQRPTPTARLIQRLAAVMTVVVRGIGLAAAIYFFAPASLLEGLRLDRLADGDVPAATSFEAPPSPLR